MKRFFTLTFFSLLLSSGFFAQNAKFLISGDSARIVTSGSPIIVLNNADWVNNGSTLALNASSGAEVRFRGDANADVDGSSSTTFFDLVSQKTGGAETRLQTDATVNNRATLLSGNFNLLNQKITLGSNGALAGEQDTISGGRRFYCADNQNGRIQKDTAISGALSAANIGNMGATITTPVNLGPTTIIRGHDRQYSALTGSTGVGRYFDIIVTNNTSINATLFVTYHEDELYSIPEGNLVYYRSPSYGVVDDWEEYGNGSYGYYGIGWGIFASNDAVNNTVNLAGIPYFSRWTISDPGTAPLPVSLLDFTGVCDGSNIVLQWRTASETNSKNFIIQKSMNLIDWELLAQVQAAGNSNQILEYAVSDLRINDISYYYRIVQIDINGKSQIFDPIAVNCAGNGLGENNIHVYPNPTNNDFTVEITVDRAHDQAVISFTDMVGKTMATKNIALAEGKNQFTFSSDKLSPATYNIKVTAGDVLLPVKKLVVTKY
jgi:hypothetical protein